MKKREVNFDKFFENGFDEELFNKLNKWDKRKEFVYYNLYHQFFNNLEWEIEWVELYKRISNKEYFLFAVNKDRDMPLILVYKIMVYDRYKYTSVYSDLIKDALYITDSEDVVNYKREFKTLFNKYMKYNVSSICTTVKELYKFYSLFGKWMDKALLTQGIEILSQFYRDDYYYLLVKCRILSLAGLINQQFRNNLEFLLVVQGKGDK